MTISETMPRPRTIGERLGMVIAPAAALLYPLTLKSFNDAVTSWLSNLPMDAPSGGERG